MTEADADWSHILAIFLGDYSNRGTVRMYRGDIGRLFRYTGKTHPSEITEGDIVAFCTSGDKPANNTVFQRKARITTFMAWCLRHGIIDADPAAIFRQKNHPLRSYRRTYGKVQAKNPGRWLTHDEAFGRLVPVCQDGSLVGLRDELVIRFGLSGLRSSEIRFLDIGHLRQLPTLAWTGKGNQPRKATLGAATLDALGRYLDAYRNPCDIAALLVSVEPGWNQHTPDALAWHTRMGQNMVHNIVTRRARQAGLGHVAPHDLRRTAAGILHNSKADDGSHHFDLLDIQKVLGHSDPAITMRSYLDPMDTDVLDRAATTLQ